MTYWPSKKIGKQSGFTLVELLITVVIMVISLAIGMTNYLRYLDKQQLYQFGSNIEAMLKDARSKAQTGFLGNSDIGFCVKLASVDVATSLDVDGKVYSDMKIRCSDGSSMTYETQAIDKDSVSIDKTFVMSFLPMRGAVVTLGGASVSSGSAILSRGDSGVVFNLDQGGTINVKYQ